jgi:hypothetical protein
MSAEVLDARNRRHELDRGAKGPKVRLHLRVERGHGGIKRVDLIEMKTKQKAMVLRDPAAKGSSGDAFTRRLARLASLAELVSPAISASIIARPLLPVKIGEHRVQFDVGAPECLLDPQNMAGLFTNQLLTRVRRLPTRTRSKMPRLSPILECRLDAPPADPRKGPIGRTLGTVGDVPAPDIRSDRID